MFLSTKGCCYRNIPAEYDKTKACRNTLSCATAILEIIREVINPAFKENGLPQITVRNGLDFGEVLVVLEGPHRYYRFKHKYGFKDCLNSTA